MIALNSKRPRASPLFLLRLLMFIFGLFPAMLYLPCFSIYLLSQLFAYNKIKVKRFFVCYFVVSIFFIGYTWILGSNTFLPNRLATCITQLVSVATVAYIVSKNDLQVLKELLSYFVWGVSFYILSIIFLTIYQDPLLITRNQLRSPFSDELINTASISNYLALVACLLFYFILTSSKRVNIFMAGLIFTTVIFFAIALSGRTFFIVTFPYCLAMAVKHKKLKQLVFFVVLLTVLALSLSAYFDNFINPLVEKSQNGLASLRFAHWHHAIQLAPNFPLGGFEVDQGIEEIGSFHNIIFDAARLGGYLSVFLFLVLVFPSVAVLTKHKLSSDLFLFYGLSVVTLLIMMQDVIIEGSYKFLIFYLFLNLAIIKFKFK